MQVGRNVDVSWGGIDIFVKHRPLLQQGRAFDMLGVGIGAIEPIIDRLDHRGDPGIKPVRLA